MPLRDVIAIGGSLGAVAALRRLCADLPSYLPAALFIIVHVGQHVSDLAGGLQSGSALPVISAHDGAQVEPGKIYAYALRDVIAIGAFLEMLGLIIKTAADGLK